VSFIGKQIVVGKTSADKVRFTKQIFLLPQNTPPPKKNKNNKTTKTTVL